MVSTPGAAPGRAVAGSIGELLAGVTHREPMKGADSLSTASFERVVIDGERFVVKYLHCDEDWIMRATGDVVGRPVLMWTSGLFDELPDCLDHTVVGVAAGLGRNGWGSALLMRDRGSWFVPDDGSPVGIDQHLRFIGHMAALHAHFWGWEPTVDLAPAGNRYLFFNEHLAGIEQALGSGARVPDLVAPGYARMAEISPAAHELARAVHAEPSAFLDAIEEEPLTFIHSDWKLGNLGSHPDGRTILVDWAFCGHGPALSDLAWYLGVNTRRFPQSREDCIDTYRRALEGRGVDTAGWFERQLGLALLGCFLQQGWSKTFDGRDEEFTWWEQRALDAARYLA